MEVLPRIGFGAGPLGGLYRSVPDDDAIAAVVAAVEVGYRYFDTAPLYGCGAAERVLGRGLAACGAGAPDVIVSTKVGRLIDETAPRPPGDLFAGTTGAAVFDFSADGVYRSLEASLARLGRDRVDVVFIHDPDDHAHQALTEAYPALERLRGEGAVSAIGVGMNRPGLPTRFVRETDIDVVLIAGRYTLLERQAEAELFPAALERGVHIVAAGVYNSGVLAGGTGPPHFDYVPAPPEIVRRAERIRAVCERFDVPPGAAAAQFAARHEAVGTVLIGARSAAQVAQNWAYLHDPIPEELWAALREA